METFNKFASVVDELIILNSEVRRAKKRLRGYLTPQEWAKEFCVVRCDIGRQSGKTQYIKNNAKVIDLICAARGCRQHFLVGQNCDVMDSSQITGLLDEQSPYFEQPYVRQRYNTIYVDEPTLFFEQIPQSVFFDVLVYDYDQTFVMLGH